MSLQHVGQFGGGAESIRTRLVRELWRRGVPPATAAGATRPARTVALISSA